MLDERLTEKENNELLSEDVYDIHEIFDNDIEAIKHIHTLTNRDYDDVLKELTLYNSVNYTLSRYQYYSCYRLLTGRLVIIEHY